MSEEPLVEVEVQSGATIVTIQLRRLDHASTAKLKGQISAAAAAHPGLPVVVDMSQLEFVPSVALGALVELNKVLRQGGQRLALAAMNRQIRSTFAVSRLDKLIDVHPTLEEALSPLDK